MNIAEIPSSLIDSRVVEILPDGRRSGMGVFTRRGFAESCRSQALERNPGAWIEIEPAHPEFPAFPTTTGGL